MAAKPPESSDFEANVVRTYANMETQNHQQNFFGGAVRPGRPRPAPLAALSDPETSHKAAAKIVSSGKLPIAATRPLRAPLAGHCRRFRIVGTCASCGEAVGELHIDAMLTVLCATCCPSCSSQRRRVGER